MKRLLASLASAVLLALSGPLPAAGQALPGPVPTWLWSVQSPEGLVHAPTAAIARGLPSALAGLSATSTLRRFPASLQALRIQGEQGALEVAIFLTDGQAAAPARVHLSFLSALSILPEASGIVAMVNGQVVGSASVKRPGRLDAVDFDIPAGLLVRGFNAVRISVDQRHRADCSVGATYELWTVIDRSQSGIIFGGAETSSTIDRLDDLPALAVRADGATSIRVVLGGKTSRQLMEQLIATVQRVALLTGSQHPVIDFGTMLDDTDGINLLVGTRDELTALLGSGAMSGSASGNVWFQPGRSGKRPSLVVTGASQAQLQESLAALGSAVGTSPGSPTGLIAAARMAGYRATGHEQYLTLGALGLTEAPFTGHFFRFDFQLVMPPDFLPVDYDRVALDLFGSYGEGLTREAHVAIEVNGTSVATALLPSSSGGTVELDQIFFPLSRLRPGANQISITAQLPRASDQACESNITSAGDKRFLLSEKSRIILPNIARIGRPPDLALTLNSGVAAGISDKSPTLYVPTPDSQSMSAALTLAARLAVARNQITDFHFTIDPPTAADKNLLLVAPANRLDAVLMRSIGLDPDQIRTAWDELASRAEGQQDSNDAFGASTEADVVDDACLAKAGNGPALDSHPLLASAADVNGSVPFGGSQDGLAGGLLDKLRKISDSWIGSGSLPLAVDSRTLLVVAEGRAKDDASEWTVVTAASPLLLRKSVECIVAPRRWRMLRGRQAAMEVSGRIRTIEAEKVHYRATQVLSFTNARLVFAGWLSLNSATYIAAMLLLAGCLGCATSTLLGNVGRRQK